jgi:putative Holliday junction resolvase
MKRVLGLDIGDRRIGVAISDELWVTTRGLLTIERTNIKSDTQKILDIIIKNDCSIVIIGLPLNLSGDDSKQTGKVRAFAQKLTNKLASNSMNDIKVELFDERYSTKQAEETLNELAIKHKKKSMIIDQEAAAVILEAWISNHRTMFWE